MTVVLPTICKPSQAHAALGETMFDAVEPAVFPTTILRYRNQRWAERVGLGGLSEADWLALFGRFEPFPGSFQKPLALRYHGHQFGNYNPELGDGRGFLYAQVHDLADGRLLDFGTKGSGQTPWSRHGDGRLTLNGGIREVLASSMLEAQGVDTSKSFSLVETGEELDRGDEPSPTRSAVLVRLSHSHIRIGSFQRLRYEEDRDGIVRLMDYAIRTYLPGAWRESLPERAVAFLREVGTRVARTGARWMVAGFVHGVLNTDNINITGESFDYGPWRFLPTYDPGLTAAYFDTGGRYAYGRQPGVLMWNMTRLAECLLPIAAQADLEAALADFAGAFRAAYAEETLRRLGLAGLDAAADDAFLEVFWGFVHASGAPFEQAVFDCFGGAHRPARALSPIAGLYATDAFAPVRAGLDARGLRPGASPGHVYFAGAEPCTMLHPEVERILGAVAADDWAPFSRKIEAIGTMADAYGTRVRPPA